MGMEKDPTGSIYPKSKSPACSGNSGNVPATASLRSLSTGFALLPPSGHYVWAEQSYALLPPFATPSPAPRYPSPTPPSPRRLALPVHLHHHRPELSRGHVPAGFGVDFHGYALEGQPARGGPGLLSRANGGGDGARDAAGDALELLGEGVERRGAVRGAPDAGREDDAALFAGLAQQRLHVRRVAGARRLQRAREHAEIHGAGDAHLRLRRLVRLRVDRRRPSIALELGAGLLERLFERPGGGRERRDEDQRKRYEENPSHDATSTPDSG